MRIGVVTEPSPPTQAGVPEHVALFAREARRLGHVVKVVTGSTPDAPPRDPPDVIRVGGSVPWLSRGAEGRVTGGTGTGAALREVLARERFDVVHVHAPLAPVLPLLAVHHARGPVVGSFRGGFRPGLLSRLARAWLQRYLDRLDGVVLPSRAAAATLRDSVRGDLRVIPGGVDLERFGHGRRLPAFQDGKLTVLWLGRLEPRCGLEVVLQGFRKAARQVDARLVVAGEGPLRARFRARVPGELGDAVTFVPAPAEERPDLVATADVVCVSARGDGAPGFALEAMASAKPLVLSDCEGHRDLVQHGREGELVEPDDAPAWARALVRLSREPIRAASYGERARLAAQRHGWPAVAREVLGLYRSIGVRG